MIEIWKTARGPITVILMMIAILTLPFAINQVLARDRLHDRLTERISELQMQGQADTELLRCLRTASQEVVAIRNGGKRDGEGDFWAMREILQTDSCPQTSSRSDEPNETSWDLPSFLVPNTWPTDVLVFFIVITTSVIGYGTTTLRKGARFDYREAGLAAALAFAAVISVRSGSNLMFPIEAGDTTYQSTGVFGISLIGFLIGISTTTAYQRFLRMAEDSPGRRDTPDDP